MKRSTFTLGLVVALCTGAATTGTVALVRYETTSGPVAAAPLELPSRSIVSHASNRAHLVMFVHPQCPCTRATIRELSNVMTRRGANLNAFVLVYEPKNKPLDWNRNDIEESARKIPGVTILKDFQGMEAKRFHSATSGQTLLYDRNGKLIFSGGITGARGQVGDNAGLDSLISVIDRSLTQKSDIEPRNSIKTSKVFGCLIQQRKDFQEKEGDLCLN